MKNSQDLFLENLQKISQQVWQVQMELLGKPGSFQAGSFQEGNFGLLSNLYKNYLNISAYFSSHPEKFLELQMEYFRKQLDIVNSTVEKLDGESIAPEKFDRRFRDKAWQDNAFFSYLRDSYLLYAKTLQSYVGNADGLDDKSKRLTEFYTKQLTDALAPTNFPLTNPVVLQEIIETNGENLIKGLDNLLSDLRQKKISQVDGGQFRLGKNIAATPGKVVFKNKLFELINYNPHGDKIFEIPLLLVPAWINKFYILDLSPENSFVKWLVEKGYNVFVVSWVNPDESYRDKSFDYYMREGLIAAIDEVFKASGAAKLNLMSYCLGGTLSAATLAYFASKKINKVNSVTYLTTLVDFSDAGDLAVFVDDDQLEDLEKQMDKQGYLDGTKMSQVFNMLRPSDLIWSFVINNYMLGKKPLPFDLLYWNADATRMPAKMHSFYLRNMYQNNLLCKKNALKMLDVPIDLTKITTPSYILSTKEDHIAPWKSTFAATKLYSGAVRFVLSASGHVAGVINPPAKNKYGFWAVDKNINDWSKLTPEKWLQQAKEQQKSWWDDWLEWSKTYSGKKIAVKTAKKGMAKGKSLTPAPGEYVKIR